MKEILHKQVGGFDADLEQFPAASRFIMRYTRFDEVSVAVQLVFDLQTDPALAREMDLVVGKEVTIVHLSVRQKGDQGVHKGGKRRVRLNRQDP